MRENNEKLAQKVLKKVLTANLNNHEETPQKVLLIKRG
jgi:hypothetical protein